MLDSDQIREYISSMKDTLITLQEIADKIEELEAELTMAKDIIPELEV